VAGASAVVSGLTLSTGSCSWRNSELSGSGASCGPVVMPSTLRPVPSIRHLKQGLPSKASYPPQSMVADRSGRCTHIAVRRQTRCRVVIWCFGGWLGCAPVLVDQSTEYSVASDRGIEGITMAVS
jgi:hypothetical protein